MHTTNSASVTFQPSKRWLGELNRTSTKKSKILMEWTENDHLQEAANIPPVEEITSLSTPESEYPEVSFFKGPLEQYKNENEWGDLEE